MNVGESAESAVQHLGPLDVYEKYLLHSGHKAEGKWQVRYEAESENGAQSAWPWNFFLAPFLIEPQGPMRNDRYTNTFLQYILHNKTRMNLKYARIHDSRTPSGPSKRKRCRRVVIVFLFQGRRKAKPTETDFSW